MTALNVIVQANAVHLITDAAGFDAEGRVTVIESKVIAWDGSRLALGWSGTGGHHAIAAAIMGERPPASISDLLTLLPAIAHQVNLGAVRDMGPEWAGLQIVACFWDQGRNSPRALAVTTHRTGWAAALRPGHLTELTHLTTPQVDLSAVLGRPFDKATNAGFDATRDGRALLEAQRRVTWEIGGVAVHQVGGFGGRHTITAAGVERAELIRWPDEVGRRIEPERRMAP